MSNNGLRIMDGWKTGVAVALFGVLTLSTSGVAQSPALPAADSPAPRNVFHADVEALASRPHRLAGRENGSRAASLHVEQRLRAMGVDEVLVQEFPVVQPRMRECILEADGTGYPLFAVRPNVLQASITPARGISGETVYLGRGGFDAFATNTLAGRVAVLDFDCDEEWLNAFAFGASAVLFVDRPGQLAQPHHHVNIPANLPRFYVPPETAATLALTGPPRRVTLRAACEWESLRGRSVIGIIRGTAKPAPAARAEAVVLAAPLDAYSEIPELSPGAREAGNAAALLHIAQGLCANRPGRDTVVAFLDGQALSHAGARAFYGSLYRRQGARKLAEHTLEERLDMTDAEDRYNRSILEVLSKPDLFASDTRRMPGYRDAMRIVRSGAFGRSGELLRQLGPLRMRMKQLNTPNPDPVPENAEAERIALGGQGVELGSITHLKMQELAWNSFLRCMDEGQAPDISRAGQLAGKLVTDPLEARQQRMQEAFASQLLKCLDEARDEARQNSQQRLRELDLRRQEIGASMALHDALGPQREAIVLHLGLNLGDDGAAWSFVHGDDSGPQGDDPEGLYSGIYKAIREICTAVPDAADFDSRPVEASYSSRSFVPTPFTDSTSVARMFALFNLSIMTLHDPLERQGLPSDSIAMLATDRMASQAAEVLPFVRRLIDHPDLGRDFPLRAQVRFDEEYWTGAKAFGHTVRQGDLGDPMQPGIVSGAVVAGIPMTGSTPWESPALRKLPRGFVPELIVRSQSNGNFEMPPVSRLQKLPILAASYDDEGRGLISRVTASASFGPQIERIVKTIGVQSLTLAGWGFDRPTPTTVMHALSTSRFAADLHLACESGNLLVLFTPPDVSATKLFNAYGMVLLNNDARGANAYGKGVPTADPFARMVTPEATAADLLHLNDHRLGLLRSTRIAEPSLEVLHGRAADLRTDAGSQRDDIRRQSMMAASAGYSRRLYEPLVGVMKDLVSAVIFLLLLALPFAFALERLLVGSPHIYRRLGWFATFFLATFALLYQVNPAFKLAATPAIIFLAFGVMLLSLLVIFIMTRKLQTEIRLMQGMSATAHSADVSRLSTMSTAVSMGISTMRRRKLRTLLTSMTAVLLTFTILTFASFSNEWGNRRTYIGPMPDGQSRLLIRHLLWMPLAHDTYAMLRGFLSNQADVVPRYWLAPTAQDVANASAAKQSLDMLITTESNGRVTPISAAVGIAPLDLKRDSAITAHMSDDTRLDLMAEDGILLSRAVSETLGLTADGIGQARLRFAGQRLTYAGTFEPSLGAQVMLDGSSVLPVDYKASLGAGADMAQTAQQPTAAGASVSFVPFPADAVVLISAVTAARAGADIRGITVYPADRSQVGAIAEDAAIITGLPTFEGSAGGVHRLLFSTLVAASGFRDLVVPIALGGLIIFATMLGSVTDRAREIRTFSSLGLAPPHVAMLFFAESIIYAVIGGMGGYLLGQVSVRAMAIIGHWGHFAVPTMNFSSMNAVVTILIVMGIVMLSTLYPALKASRSANPGVQRAWRLPPPQGDVYDILFPFTVSAYDLIGIASYLDEHFHNFSDASIGRFATVDCRIFRQQESDTLGFEARVALAPFDLGIEQRLVMLSQPSDVEGILEVRVLLQRTSGATGDWRRANRVFIGELRRQFLLWRTLDETAITVYRERTLGKWNDLDVETNAAANLITAAATAEGRRA